MRRSTQLLGLVSFLGFVLTTACGDDDYEVSDDSEGSGGARACIAGAREVCAGTDDCTGLRECNETGTGWSPCECGAGVGGSTGVGGSGGAELGGSAGSASGGAATGGTAGASAGGAAGTPSTASGGASSAGSPAAASGGNGGEPG